MGFWGYLYFYGTYVVAFVCLFAAGKIWYLYGWKSGVCEFLTLLFFVVAYWLLESHAQTVAPFYVYPDNFPDMVPFFNWGRFGIGPTLAAASHVCKNTGAGISATVPLLEMSMTYLFFWTARLLLTPHGFTPDVQNLAIAPFMVGLMALVLDGFLDPVISVSHTCVPVLQNHPGMDYWQWYADSSLANYWFGIPLFNYAAWYAAPVLFVTVVVLARWIVELFRYLKGEFLGPPYPAPSFMTGPYQILIGFVTAVIYVTSVGAEPPNEQVVVIFVVILISLSVIVTNAASYERNNQFRWEFVAPQLFVFALPLLMLLFSRRFILMEELVLLLLSVLFLAIGIFFSLSPYSGTWLMPSSSPLNPSRPNRPAAGGAPVGASDGGP